MTAARGADQLIGGGGNDTIVYDANDDLANVLGGGGSDILLVINGTAPTDFNLATHQFEIGDVHTTGAATGQAFNYRDNYYNTNWQLTESDTYNNDGSHSQTLFDIANIQTWSQVTTSYNGAIAKSW